MKRRSTPFLIACLATACAPHEDTPVQLSVYSARVPQGLGTACASDGSVGSDFREDADSLVLSVTGPGMSKRSKSFSVQDELVLDKIPAGENRVISVTGMKGPLPLWRGAARKVSVADKKTAAVGLLLTKLSDLTCARSGMQVPRKFHTATALQDGRVLITGGFTQETTATDCTPTGGVCRNLVATNTADVFDPVKGTFEPVGTMTGARGFHTAQALPDGRVVILGGVSTAKVDTQAPFPFVPTANAGVRAVEVFDPSTGEFTVIGDEPEPGIARTFSAGIQLKDGRVMFTGGGTPSLLSGTPGNERANATNSSVVCDGSGGDVVCTIGPSMIEARVGHVLTYINESRSDGGELMAFGGVVGVGQSSGLDDNGNATQVTRQAPEFYDGTQWLFTKDRPVYVNGTNADNNIFFGSVMKVKGVPGPLIVGGLARAEGATGMNFLPPKRQAWLVDEAEHWMAVGIDDVEFLLQVPRYLGQTAQFGDGKKWIYAGGFEDLANVTPSPVMEFIDSSESSRNRLIFTQITLASVPRTLRQARGGLTVTALPSSISVLVAGGGRTDGTTAAIMDTAEIFTDSAEPTP